MISLVRSTKLQQIALLLVCIASAQGSLKCEPKQSQSSRQFSVSSKPDSTGLFPNSREYSGTLKNTGQMPLDLESVELIGDKARSFAGSGRFFPCTIEAWNESDHHWHAIKSPRLEDYGKHQKSQIFELAPGKEIKVCGWLLPQQAGQKGNLARFRIRFKWSGKSRSLVSHSFTLGKDVVPSK